MSADPADDLFFDDRETLDPDDIAGDAALPDARQRGFVGRPARSIFTDGQESRFEAIIDGDFFELLEGSSPLIATTPDFDAALEAALDAGGAVVIGDPLGDDPFSVRHWPEGADITPPCALDLQATPDIGAIVMGGAPLFPAHPAKRTVRWVTVPGLREFWGLPDDLKRWVRAPMEQAWSRGADLPELKHAIEDIPFATLRLLIASHPHVVPVKTVVRKGVDRGAVVYGVTRPYLTADLDEPAIYLPVISMKEGNVDAINAWDLDAGISLGPVQFNVIGGHLFSALLTAWREDPALFRACFGSLGWTATEVDGRPALVVEKDGAQVTLMSKRGEDRDGIRRNAGYFQAGEAGKWGLSQIDGDFRRDLAARFRNLALWPHAQRWLMGESGAYLDRGRGRMDRAKVPPVDPAALDADGYTLRALLMSGYVRYGASLRYTLEQLDGLGRDDAGALLERLPKALAGVAAKSDAWATRIDRLQDRYYGKGSKPGQVDHAKTVLSMRG